MPGLEEGAFQVQEDPFPTSLGTLCKCHCLFRPSGVGPEPLSKLPAPLSQGLVCINSMTGRHRGVEVMDGRGQRARWGPWGTHGTSLALGMGQKTWNSGNSPRRNSQGNEHGRVSSAPRWEQP